MDSHWYSIPFGILCFASTCSSYGRVRSVLSSTVYRAVLAWCPIWQGSHLHLGTVGLLNSAKRRSCNIRMGSIWTCHPRCWNDLRRWNYLHALHQIDLVESDLAGIVFDTRRSRSHTTLPSL